MNYYGMDGQPIGQAEAMALFNSDGGRSVAYDDIGDVSVSTVLLVLDHSFGRLRERPLIFETMIFGGEHDQFQVRYSTKAEALAGHAHAIAMVKGETDASD